MNPVIISPEAEGDLAEAYQWYEARVEGLGGEFLLCVEVCIQSAAGKEY